MDSAKEERNYCVYMHISPSEKVYIGITFRTPQIRWGKNGNGYKDNQYFYRAIQKYGWDNFRHEIILDNLTRQEACGVEQLLISLFNANDEKCGYNHTIGGDCGTKGWHPSEEIRRKISNSKLKEKNPMYGKHYDMSNETKEKLSKQKLGDKNPMFGKSGDKHHNSIPVCQCDSDWNVISFFWNIYEAERITGSNKHNINTVCNKTPNKNGYIRKTAGGYHWRFATREEIENVKNSCI